VRPRTVTVRLRYLRRRRAVVHRPATSDCARAAPITRLDPVAPGAACHGGVR